jgi:hypothetical protein
MGIGGVMYPKLPIISFLGGTLNLLFLEQLNLEGL